MWLQKCVRDGAGKRPSMDNKSRKERGEVNFWPNFYADVLCRQSPVTIQQQCMYNLLKQHIGNNNLSFLTPLLEKQSQLETDFIPRNNC